MGTIENDHLDELHVPTAPNDIVQPDFILPTKFHSQEPVPLGGSQLLPIGDRHALQVFFNSVSRTGRNFYHFSENLTCVGQISVNFFTMSNPS